MAAARRAVAAALRCVAATAKSAGIYPAPSSVTSPITHSPTCAAAARSSAVVCIAPRCASFFSIAPSNAAAASRSGAFCNVSPSSAAAASRSGAFVNVSPSSAAAPGSADVFSISPSAAPGSAVFFTISPSAAGSVAVINISPSSAAKAGSASFFSISPSAAAKAGSGAFHSSSASATNRATARMGFHAGSITRASASSGMRSYHALVPKPIESHLLIELAQLDARLFARYKEIADALHELGQRFKDGEAAYLQYLTEQNVHIGTLTWKVCTSVLTVAVAAGLGVLQLTKSDWELENHEAACALVTSRLAETRIELDKCMGERITHRRSVSAAKLFLDDQNNKERANELEERQASLVRREADLVSREKAARSTS